jgi:DNA primase
MRIRVAAMPAGEDPAEMVAAEGGAERFAALVEGAVELAAFQIGLVLDGTDVASAADRERALNEVAPVLAAMGNTPGREEQVRRVKERLDLEVGMVMGRMTAATPTVGGPAVSTPAPVPVRRTSGELTSRERRERALLAMCVTEPDPGRQYLERLTEAHLSPLGGRALAWIRKHPDDLASNLPSDDDELAGLIAELVIVAREEPASPEAMELNFLQLEQRRLEAEITAAGEAEESERRAQLSKERAALVQRIAHAERVG